MRRRVDGDEAAKALSKPKDRCARMFAADELVKHREIALPDFRARDVTAIASGRIIALPTQLIRIGDAAVLTQMLAERPEIG